MLKLSLVETRAIASWLPELTDPRVRVWQTSAGVVCAYGYIEEGTHWMHLPGLATFAFQRGAQEVMAFVPPSSQVEVIHNAYYRSVLPMALQALGTEVLHASAIRTHQGIVAFCAASGTGKSTLACALNVHGYALWADDAVACDIGGERVAAFALPFAVHLRSEAETFFNHKAHWPCEQRPDGNNPVVQTEPVRLVAVFVLRRFSVEAAHGEIAAERLTPAFAFPALLAHAYCFSLDERERKRRMTQSYLDLVRQVPIYTLRFPSRLELLPQIVECIEETLQNL